MYFMGDINFNDIFCFKNLNITHEIKKFCCSYNFFSHFFYLIYDRSPIYFYYEFHFLPTFHVIYFQLGFFLAADKYMYRYCLIVSCFFLLKPIVTGCPQSNGSQRPYSNWDIVISIKFIEIKIKDFLAHKFFLGVLYFLLWITC